MSEAAKRVSVIPATIMPLTQAPLGQMKKRLTAAYARVSTGSEEQKTSYDAQIKYYTDYINSREDWIFTQVYADAARTGVQKWRSRLQNFKTVCNLDFAHFPLILLRFSGKRCQGCKVAKDIYDLLCCKIVFSARRASLKIAFS